MNPDIEARILAARSPDEMKRAVIDALRELWAAIEQQPSDPWASGWDDHEAHLSANRELAQSIRLKNQQVAPRFHTQEEADAARLAARINADPKLARHIAKLEDALVTCVDGEEEQAILAKLALLREGGAEPEQVLDDGVPPTITQVGEEGFVDFTAVSLERKAARYAWAKERRLWEFITLPEDAACETFAKGGPMWLYLNEGGRDAILAMPPQWRAELINEVQQDSPREAYHMGRDLMKQEDALDPDGSPAGQAALARAAEAFNG